MSVLKRILRAAGFLILVLLAFAVGVPKLFPDVSPRRGPPSSW